MGTLELMQITKGKVHTKYHTPYESLNNKIRSVELLTNKNFDIFDFVLGY